MNVKCDPQQKSYYDEWIPKDYDEWIAKDMNFGKHQFPEVHGWCGGCPVCKPERFTAEEHEAYRKKSRENNDEMKRRSTSDWAQQGGLV